MHIKCELFAIIFRKECKVQISMKMFHENNKVFELRKKTIFYLFSSGADTELNTGVANCRRKTLAPPGSPLRGC